MADKEKVESFRLTPQMKAFQKQYKQLNKIGVMLRQDLAVKLGEADEVRQALGQLEQGLNQMLMIIPEQKVKEIEGQEDQAIQRQFSPNY